MKISVYSLFSNSFSSGHLDYYFPQVIALSESLKMQGDSLVCAWCEGDSTDDTYEELKRRAKYAQLDYRIAQHHHGHVFPSVVHPDRFKALAAVGNKCLSLVPEDTDILYLVESDIVVPLETSLGLIKHVCNGLDAVVPLIWFKEQGDINGNGFFYDTFCYRKDSQRFTWNYPYHPSLQTEGPLVELDSAGSVMAINAKYIRQGVRFGEAACFIDFCHDVRRLGGHIMLDKGLQALHPKRSYDP